MEYIHPDMALFLAATFVSALFIRLYRQTVVEVRGFGWIFSGLALFLLASLLNYIEETPLAFLMLAFTDEEGWDFIVPVLGYAPGGLMFSIGFTEWLRMAFRLKNEIQQREIAEDELKVALVEAGQANAAKDQFLSIMSHELKTPLTAIIGFSEIMSDPKYRKLSVAEYADYSDVILRSSNHLLETINNILLLSQMQAKEYQLKEETLCVEELINECMFVLSGEASKAHVRLSKPLLGSTTVFADQRLVKQIVLNLVSNGIKFARDGGAVTCSLDVNPVQGITILVSDTGVGMTSDEAKLALEPFTQLSDAKSRQKMGAGLGLTLVKRFTELHNGAVEITSQRGKGTDVRIIFPASRLRHIQTKKGASAMDTPSISSAVAGLAD